MDEDFYELFQLVKTLESYMNDCFIEYGISGLVNLGEDAGEIEVLAQIVHSKALFLKRKVRGNAKNH